MQISRERKLTGSHSCFMQVDQLSTFQRSDQQNAFRIKVESILNEVSSLSEFPGKYSAVKNVLNGGHPSCHSIAC
eukprot:297393-Pelagomonas_calceolata.AAC.7